MLDRLLERILLFIAQGGLEDLQNRRLDKLETDTDRLNTRVSEVELMQKLLHLWDGKRIILRGF